VLKGGEGVPYLLQTYLEGVLLPNPSIFKSPSLFERFLPSQNHLGGGPLEVFCRGMTLKGEEGGVPQERRGEIPFSLSLSSEVPFLPITMDELRVPFLSSLNLVPVRQRSGREERGGVFQNPTTLPFFFFLPQRGSRSLFVDGLLSWNPAKERGPTFPS
jgi:hypothetical protein